jgi:uncharacterized damage-inducible protein DinB
MFRLGDTIMKFRSLSIASCLLFVGHVALAQAGAASDPVTGTWKGDMAPKGAPSRTAVTLELKLDGKTVSGTLVGLPVPGDIKAGSFDSTTGALRLEVAPKGNSTIGLVLEGKVLDGAVSGRVTGDNQVGDFKIAKVATESAAPQRGSNDAAAVVRHGFGEVSGWITKAAALVPDDKYSYRPTQSVRTFGQLIAHIANGYDYYCAAAGGKKAQWSDASEKGKTDKATMAQTLKQSTDACNAAYGSGSQIAPLMANIAHANLHYGNIITYMRMLGLTPPSS